MARPAAMILPEQSSQVRRGWTLYRWLEEALVKTVRQNIRLFRFDQLHLL